MNYGLFDFPVEKRFFGGLLDEFLARAKATPENLVRDPMGSLLGGVNTSLDFAPVVGGVKGTIESAQQGEPGWALFNAATVPADLLVPGSGVAMKAAGAKLAPELAGLLGMTAWHGSPHKWDKVDLSKIGTGEGAQAYGHGFYAAENKDTAGYYKDVLSRKSRGPGTYTEDIYLDGKLVSGSTPSDQLTDLEAAALNYHYAGGIKQQAIDDLKGDMEIFPAGSWAHDNAKRLINVLEKEDFSGRIKPYFNEGHLYELDIPDTTIDKMLDWDAPLSEQPESVRKAMEKLGTRINPSEPVGVAFDRAKHNKLYGGDIIGKDRATMEEISAELNKVGIPGIKYWDGDSRAAGEGTRNFVLFNEDDVKVLSRNGEKVGGLLK